MESRRKNSFSIEAAAEDFPNRVAVVGPARALTYAELADRVLARLRSWNIGSDASSAHVRVAAVADLSVETVESLLALLAREVAVVLVHPRWTAREREAVLERAQPIALVENGRWLPRSTTSSQNVAHASDCALVAYTSGTTGEPRGAMLTHRALTAAANASALNLGWKDDDRWLLCMPPAHVGGVSVLLRVLLARRTVVLADSPRFDPAAVARKLVSDKVTLVSMVPTMLARLLNHDPTWTPPSWIRAVLLGGAPAPKRLLERAADRGVPVLTTYGLTEACGQVTTERYGARPPHVRGAGQPLVDGAVRVIDDRIEVRGPTLFSGYLGEEHPELAQGGWWDTGDLGRWIAGGHLQVIGRNADLILTGGENVYPAEVEAALLEVPEIEAACVFGLPDAEWGERVCAALVTRSGSLDWSAFGRHLRAILAPHKRPRLGCLLPTLALLPNGKIDRQQVVDEARERLRVL